MKLVFALIFAIWLVAFSSFSCIASSDASETGIASGTEALIASEAFGSSADDSDLSRYQEFFVKGSLTASTAFERFNISGFEPEALLTAGSPVPFSQQCTMGNELWIRGNRTWTQYTICPEGSSLSIVAFAPTGGDGQLYRILSSEGSLAYTPISLGPGYYAMTFASDVPGRNILLFELNGHPSSSIIIDVVPQIAPTGGEVTEVPDDLAGVAEVTVISEWLTGFDVLCDGVFYRSDGGDGRADGIVSFTVPDEGPHTITVTKRVSIGNRPYRSDHALDIVSGNAYTIRV